MPEQRQQVVEQQAEPTTSWWAGLFSLKKDNEKETTSNSSTSKNLSLTKNKTPTLAEFHALKAELDLKKTELEKQSGEVENQKVICPENVPLTLLRSRSSFCMTKTKSTLPIA